MVMAVVMRETAHGEGPIDELSQQNHSRCHPGFAAREDRDPSTPTAGDCHESFTCMGPGQALRAFRDDIGVWALSAPYPMTPVPPVAAITWPWMNSASGLSRYSTSEA